MWHQTIVVGNLGGDPKLTYFNDGSSVCSFSVAVTDKWKDRQTGERKERTTWYRVNVRGPMSEHCNTYLSAGRKVMAIGTVMAKTYESKGEQRASLELYARDVRFLSSRDEGASQPARSNTRVGKPQGYMAEDDIPF